MRAINLMGIYLGGLTHIIDYRSHTQSNPNQHEAHE